MSAVKAGKSSPLVDFFSNASAQTKRGVFEEVISKAIASQLEVIEKAEAIKKTRKSSNATT